MDDVRNILIVRTDRMGDVVLTTPVVKALRQRLPHARISMLVTPVTEDLVRGLPGLDDVIIDDRKFEHKGIGGFFRLVRDIRQGRFDAALIFHTKRRTNLLCALAGIPRRIGYRNNKFGFLLTHPLKDERHHGAKHESQYCLDVIAALQLAVPSEFSVAVTFQRDAEAWADAWLAQNGLKPSDLVAIHPSASDATKRWPPACFAELMTRLYEEDHKQTVLIGGEEARPIAAEIEDLLSIPRFNLTGQISVAQMASLLKRCALLVSNDSGPVHVGAAAGTAVISLFLRNQPGLNPERWRPVGLRTAYLVNPPGEEIRLSPDLRVISGRHDAISVDDVIAQARKLTA